MLQCPRTHVRGLGLHPPFCYIRCGVGGRAMRCSCILLLLCQTGCASGEQTQGVLASASASAQDCRTPATIYGAFQIRATKVTWTGSQVTLAFEVRNITNRPKSMRTGSNGPDTVSGTLKVELISSSGNTYAARNFATIDGPLGPLGAPLLNPGIGAQSRVTFDAPKGPYTFKLTRFGMDLNTVYDPEVWTCSVVS
jgi:hypothetical protein